MSKKELQVFKAQRLKAIQDSLVQDSLQRIAQAAKLDSIRIADSLAALPPPVDPDTVFVASIMRLPCYGNKCPHYEMEIYASGRAVYRGKAAVKRIGEYYGNISPSLIEELQQKARESHFLQLDNRYPARSRGVEDFPLCVTQVQLDQQWKTIYNRNDAPAPLLRFERYLDALAQNIEWSASKETNAAPQRKGLLDK